jgi:hypothetical protein
MDYDGIQPDKEQSPEPQQVFLEDDKDEGEWQRERLKTHVYDAEASLCYTLIPSQKLNAIPQSISLKNSQCFTQEKAQ